ncbi:hypothetical protein HMPREF1574_01069 [Gardnerella pickettii JCP7659]|nr:hypothetical protein HMPREF1574_01069 [Gardnerella pickettii JCP7659]
MESQCTFHASATPISPTLRRNPKTNKAHITKQLDAIALASINSL